MMRRELAAAMLGGGVIAYASEARAQTTGFAKATELQQLVGSRDKLTLIVATVSSMRIVLAISRYGSDTSGEKIVNDPVFNQYRNMILSEPGQHALQEELLKDPTGVDARIENLREKTLNATMERLTSVLREACGASGSRVSIEFRQTFVLFTELVEVSKREPTPAGKGWWCDCYGLSILCA